MSRTYKIIDADGHILEPLDIWDRYMDPAYRERAPRVVLDDNGKERLLIEGPDPRQSQGPGPARRRRGPGRLRAGRHDEIHGWASRRLRSARAHQGHGARRHRRGVPLSEHRVVL